MRARGGDQTLAVRAVDDLDLDRRPDDVDEVRVDPVPDLPHRVVDVRDSPEPAEANDLAVGVDADARHHPARHTRPRLFPAAATSAATGAVGDCTRPVMGPSYA